MRDFSEPFIELPHGTVLFPHTRADSSRYFRPGITAVADSPRLTSESTGRTLPRLNSPLTKSALDLRGLIWFFEALIRQEESALLDQANAS